jgi:hypothetical protein
MFPGDFEVPDSYTLLTGTGDRILKESAPTLDLCNWRIFCDIY